jgi:hypothetical protein
MAGMFDEQKIIGVPTALQAFFGNPANGSQTIFSPDANQVDIDIIRGNERTAALVPRGMVSRVLGGGQKNLRMEQFSSFSRKYPLSVEEGDVTGENLTTRIAGESAVNSSVTQMDRLRHHAVRIHHESVRREIRLFERLAAESLMTGKQSAILGTANTDLIYDFRRHADMFIQGAVSWAGGLANILADLDLGCSRMRSRGHMTPDMAVFGDGAMNSFIRDATVQKLADNRRFTYISLGDGANMPAKFQRFVDGGMVFQGTVRTPKGYNLNLFTYPDVYTADNGTATKYIADDKVLLTTVGARADRYFGPPEGLPMVPARAQLYREFFGFDPGAPLMPPKIKAAGGVIAPEAFFCDAYVSNDWTRLTIRCQSAPIFATTQTDAFVVLDTEP